MVLFELLSARRTLFLRNLQGDVLNHKKQCDYQWPTIFARSINTLRALFKGILLSSVGNI